MRLGASNLAWSRDETHAALAILTRHGFATVEAAPTMIAPWEELTPAKLAGYRHECEGAGLSIGSLQAILFNKPDCSLLGDAAGFQSLCEHMERVDAIADQLGASVAVFGAPANRRRGDRPVDEAFAMARDRFSALGRRLQRLTLVLEPVPAAYGGDFLTTIVEVNELVAACGCATIRSHIDTACVTLAGDDVPDAIRQTGPLLRHFHIAEPQLVPFDRPSPLHTGAALALAQAGYQGDAVLEMRRSEQGSLANLETAVRFIIQTYRHSTSGSHSA